MIRFNCQSRNRNFLTESVLGGPRGCWICAAPLKMLCYQMRASLQDLESSLRRREADISSEVGSYLISKKKANKMVSKCFASFKKPRNNKLVLLDENHEVLAMVSMLREVEDVSITIFKSLFSSICPKIATSKENRWSLVSKLAKSKHLYCEGEREVVMNEVQKMDMALAALCKQKSSKDNDILRMQEVQKCLMALDTRTRQCEEDVECLFRSLIKTRVSFLNMLNHKLLLGQFTRLK